MPTASSGADLALPVLPGSSHAVAHLSTLPHLTTFTAVTVLLPLALPHACRRLHLRLRCKEQPLRFGLRWRLSPINSTFCSEISRNFGPDFVHQPGLSCLGVGKQRH